MEGSSRGVAVAGLVGGRGEGLRGPNRRESTGFWVLRCGGTGSGERGT
jgi:hypothetical protein